MIKASLQSSRKESPEVKITMNFDKVQFYGGIQQLGKLKSDERGIKKYTIDCYSDLDSLLGRKWFIRGINESGDFCYVMLETFYLRNLPSLTTSRMDQNSGSSFTLEVTI